MKTKKQMAIGRDMEDHRCKYTYMYVFVSQEREHRDDDLRRCWCGCNRTRTRKKQIGSWVEDGSDGGDVSGGARPGEREEAIDRCLWLPWWSTDMVTASGGWACVITWASGEVHGGSGV